MRVHKETNLVIDEFELEEPEANDRGLKGVLQLIDEHDDSDMIFLSVGTTQLGWILKEKLVEVAEKILELWKEEAKP